MKHKGNSPCHVCTMTGNHAHNRLRPDTPINQRKWIGVDFDGTLSKDNAWRDDPYSVGDPVPLMVKRVKEWLAQGFEVRMLTARLSPLSHTSEVPRDMARMRAALDAWCLEHLGQTIPLTNAKDGLMDVLWDDRAVRVKRDQGIPVVKASIMEIL